MATPSMSPAGKNIVDTAIATGNFKTLAIVFALKLAKRLWRAANTIR